MTLSPATADAGVVFVLRRASEDAVIAADWSRVDATRLRTRISGDGASVSTIEHLMAALAGMGVDNALVELDEAEVPAMDGSARDFVAAIDEAGVAGLSAPRCFLQVLEPVRVADGAAWAELRPFATGLRLDVEIAFPGARVGHQRLALDVTPETFRRELASARTFGFVRDAERLWREGLALGASLDNTVALDGDDVLNPGGLRFPDEFVRHKALDVLGDLALAGAPIIGAFRSYRGGHGLNLALVEKLMTTRGATRPIGDGATDRLPGERRAAG
jgi:UDP-3-O-[3-hydroxymyristoyl] N-acetylglucosamine deacetylase